ncbi:hypothetical protein HUT11_35425 (plasmid) [Streptomyces seoulensis]|nr:hypothetical protein HUT11_35425 [Streptomyces seoulensis]
MTDQPPARYLALTERARREAPTAPAANIKAVEYTINCLPDDDLDSHLFEIRVQYRGAGRYAVIRNGSCLGIDGTWDQGIKEYDRGQKWLDNHRFDLYTALCLAQEQAPLVTVNGHTVTDALAMRAQRAARDA